MRFFATASCAWVATPCMAAIISCIVCTAGAQLRCQCYCWLLGLRPQVERNRHDSAVSPLSPASGHKAGLESYGLRPIPRVGSRCHRAPQ